MPAWLWGQSLWGCAGKKNELIWFIVFSSWFLPRVIVCLLEQRVEAQASRAQPNQSVKISQHDLGQLTQSTIYYTPCLLSFAAAKRTRRKPSRHKQQQAKVLPACVCVDLVLMSLVPLCLDRERPFPNLPFQVPAKHKRSKQAGARKKALGRFVCAVSPCVLWLNAS